MKFRNLGHSGLEVSLAGIGTYIGAHYDADMMRAVIHKALDLGVNFIDTADLYGRGLAEEYVGKAIRGHRPGVILGTKFERRMGKGPLWAGASRRYIMEAVQASLHRLGTDYIDLYQIHYPDPTTPIEETMRALDDLVRHGDVRYVGCSNFAAWQVVEAQCLAKSERLHPFISAQNRYNLLERSVERDLVPVCEQYGLGVIPYSPLASGFLTGKYQPGRPPPEGSRLSAPSWGAPDLSDENFTRLAKLETFAQERDHPVADLALAWLASQAQVCTVIAGATRPEQVEENVRAMEWSLTPDDLAALDRVLAAQSGEDPTALSRV